VVADADPARGGPGAIRSDGRREQPPRRNGFRRWTAKRAGYQAPGAVRSPASTVRPRRGVAREAVEPRSRNAAAPAVSGFVGPRTRAQGSERASPDGPGSVRAGARKAGGLGKRAGSESGRARNARGPGANGGSERTGPGTRGGRAERATPDPPGPSIVRRLRVTASPPVVSAQPFGASPPAGASGTGASLVRTSPSRRSARSGLSIRNWRERSRPWPRRISPSSGSA